MPDEYISRAKALADFETCNAENPRWTPQRVKTLLLRQPAADVAEVVHARWERVRSNWHCTGCHKGYRITNGAPMASSFSYCPNCGAKMDGGNDNVSD